MSEMGTMFYKHGRAIIADGLSLEVTEYKSQPLSYTVTSSSSSSRNLSPLLFIVQWDTLLRDAHFYPPLTVAPVDRGNME